MVSTPTQPTSRGRTIPNGPRVRALNTWRLMRDPYRWYPAWQRAFGDTFWVRAMNGTVLVSCDPAVLRDLLRADTTEVRPFAPQATEAIIGPRSMLSLWGPRHRAERRLLSPPFHGDRMRAYGDAMLQAVDEATTAWSDGSRVVAADAMLAVSLRVIVRAVFGVLEPVLVRRWVDAIGGFLSEIHPAVVFFPALQVAPLGRGPWARFVAAKARFDRMVRDEIVARRRTGARGTDILSMLLDSTREDGSVPSDDEVVDELLTLLFAGHETTQISMSWMLYRVARDPRVAARLVAELDGSDGTPEALARLPYLDAVVNETLRLDPIVPDAIRTLAVPMTLGDYAFPAGTHVAIAAALVHAQSDLYPEPAAFRPERFLERTFKPHEFLPFGGGVRRCLGASLATWEMKVVVGTLLRRFAFTSVSEEQPVRRNVTTGPRHGVVLDVRARVRPVSPEAAEGSR